MEIATKQDKENSLDVTKSLILPSLPNKFVGDGRESVDDKAVPKSLVGMKVSHLVVDGGLVLHHLVQSVLILLQHNHALFQNAGRFAQMQHKLICRSLQHLELILSRIEQMQNILETRVGSQMDPIGFEILCRIAWWDV